MLLALPVFAAAQSTGSLFVAGGRLVDFTRDGDAAQVGDLITILVNDTASALASGNSTTSRKTSVSSSASSSLFPNASARLANLLGTSGDVELAGTGQTARNMTISTTISARVIEVTSTGSLVVEGTKHIGVNSEKQTITLRGVIRPIDLTTANTISSNQVANMSIQIDGKGVVGDAIRRPHFLYRLLLGLLPF